MAKNKLGIVLDQETADGITRANLKDYRRLIKSMLKDHNEKGQYMHPEDVVGNTVFLVHLDAVIKHFTGPGAN